MVVWRETGRVVVNKTSRCLQSRVMRWFGLLERMGRVETGANEDSLMDGP
jgi:hypothetical protein